MTLEELSEKYNEGEKASMTIHYLNEKKHLLKTDRGRDLFMECKKIKSKWDEYESMKMDMRLNNPGISEHDYKVACLEIAERLGI